MKRSEALGIIWEAINELEDADHILTRLEKAGMLPPTRLGPSLQTEEYVTADLVQTNEWAPEDEE